MYIHTANILLNLFSSSVFMVLLVALVQTCFEANRSRNPQVVLFMASSDFQQSNMTSFFSKWRNNQKLVRQQNKQRNYFRLRVCIVGVLSVLALSFSLQGYLCLSVCLINSFKICGGASIYFGDTWKEGDLIGKATLHLLSLL